MCCIYSSKEGECEWYTCVYVMYQFVEGKGVRMVYMCDIHVNIYVAHSLCVITELLFLCEPIIGEYIFTH